MELPKILGRLEALNVRPLLHSALELLVLPLHGQPPHKVQASLQWVHLEVSQLDPIQHSPRHLKRGQGLVA